MGVQLGFTRGKKDSGVAPVGVPDKRQQDRWSSVVSQVVSQIGFSWTIYLPTYLPIYLPTETVGDPDVARVPF